MGHKVLVTLDLPGATTEQREIFYQILKDEKWVKISNLDTAWKISFADGSTRDGSINVVKSHLKKAKDTSKVTRVYYAMQLDTNDVIIESI